MHWVYSFNCIVGTNAWLLEGDFCCTNALIKWVFDGTNVSESIRVLEPVKGDGTNFLFATASFEIQKTNLTVHVHDAPGGYTLGDAAVNIPWLALCSGHYLKQAQRQIPLPVVIIQHSPLAFTFTDKTEVFSDELGLPESVSLFTSRELFEKAAKLHGWAPNSSELPQDGVQKFHYIVNESTNYFGWHFPLRFEFGEDLPREIGDLRRALHGTGRVTAIESASVVGTAFDPSLQQTVVDWRFKSDRKQVDSLIYLTTNSQVTPYANTALQAKFLLKLKQAPLAPSLRRRRAKVNR